MSGKYSIAQIVYAMCNSIYSAYQSLAEITHSSHYVRIYMLGKGDEQDEVIILTHVMRITINDLGLCSRSKRWYRGKAD